MLGVDGVLDVSGETEVGVDVLDAGLVEGEVRLSHGKGVGRDKGLAFFPDGEIERRGEG